MRIFRASITLDWYQYCFCKLMFTLIKMSTRGYSIVVTMLNAGQEKELQNKEEEDVLYKGRRLKEVLNIYRFSY